MPAEALTMIIIFAQTRLSNILPSAHQFLILHRMVRWFVWKLGAVGESMETPPSGCSPCRERRNLAHRWAEIIASRRRERGKEREKTIRSNQSAAANKTTADCCVCNFINIRGRGKVRVGGGINTFPAAVDESHSQCFRQIAATKNKTKINK